MQRRTLGRTGEQLSVIGFGGIVVTDVSAGEAEAHVGGAIDRGVNYFDVAPGYGNAEERLGPALQPYRDDVFLACKTARRDGAGARVELERSLERLRTDRFDLYQFHGVSEPEQVDEILAPGGALETVAAARDRGLVRYIGFSAHDEAAAERLLDGFDFDSILAPVNLFCWEAGRFGPRFVDKAAKTDTAVLALKALAKRPWRDGERKIWPKCWYLPIDRLDEARVALSFTLSRPVTAAVSPGHAELLWLACDAAESLAHRPLTPEESPPPGEPIFTAAG